jgi:hypothetical protein
MATRSDEQPPQTTWPQRRQWCRLRKKLKSTGLPGSLPLRQRTFMHAVVAVSGSQLPCG